MGSKHRMPGPPDRTGPTKNRRTARRRAARSNVLIGSISAAVASAGVLAGVLVQLSEPPSAEAPQATVPAPAQQDRPLSQLGTIVAVTSDSVTARSADGFTRTYRITPDTTTLTEYEAAPSKPAAPFAVNDEVEIVGAVQNGTAVATAVADRARTGLNGPPMDFIDAGNSTAASSPTG